MDFNSGGAFGPGNQDSGAQNPSSDAPQDGTMDDKQNQTSQPDQGQINLPAPDPQQMADNQPKAGDSQISPTSASGGVGTPAQQKADAEHPTPLAPYQNPENAKAPGSEITPPGGYSKSQIMNPEAQELPQDRAMQESNPQSPPEFKPTPQEPLPSETVEAVNSDKSSHPTSKKVGITLFIIVIILILAGVYWYFFANKFITVSTNPTDAQVKIDDQEIAANKRVGVPSGNHVLTVSRSGYVDYQKEITVEKSTLNKVITVELKKIPTPSQVYDSGCLKIAQNTDGLFCLAADGKSIVRITDNSGNEINKTITPKTLAGIDEMIFNPTTSLAVLKIVGSSTDLAGSPFASEGAGTWLYDFNRYNLVDQEAIFWGESVDSVVWSPDGNSVYYVKNEGTVSSLIKAGKDNKTPEIVLDLKAQKVTNPILSISPDGKQIAMTPRSTDYKSNYIYYFDTYTKTATKLTTVGNDLAAKFSPDSKNLVFGVYNANSANKLATSKLYLKTTDKETDLDVLATINNTIWQNNQNMIILSTTAATETLKMISLNIESFEKTDVVWEQGSITTIGQFVLSQDNKKLYFIGKDDYLYSLEVVLNKY